MEATGKGKAAAVKPEAEVEQDLQGAKVNVGISQEQFSELLKASAVTSDAIAKSVGRSAAEAYLAGQEKMIQQQAKTAAQLAVADALARKEKISSLQKHGTNVATAAAVFVAGTLMMIGYDKYQHRNDRRANEMNPQYGASHPE